MDIPSSLTYAQLEQLLLGLGFEDRSVAGSHQAFLHVPSDTWIAFAHDAATGQRARPEDVASIRKHLLEKEILTPADLARRLHDLSAQPREER